MNIQYFLATKPLTRNHISCSESALKLTYSNVEFQNFPGENPRTPRFKGRGGEREGSRNRGEVAPWALGGWTPLVADQVVYLVQQTAYSGNTNLVADLKLTANIKLSVSSTYNVII